MHMGKTPRPSASLLVVGFVASALGGVLNVAGAGVNAAQTVSRYVPATNPGTGWIVAGLILAALGAVALIAGFYNLASGVDYLVSSHRAAEAPVKAPAETV